MNDKWTAADPRYHTAVVVLYAGTRHTGHVQGKVTATSLYIFQAIVEYAAPAWSEMCSDADYARLDSLLRRSKRLGYCSDDLPSVTDGIIGCRPVQHDELFRHVTSNSNHVLRLYLPEDIPYQLRTRSHRITLINKNKFLNDRLYHLAAVRTLVLVIVIIV